MVPKGDRHRESRSQSPFEDSPAYSLSYHTEFQVPLRPILSEGIRKLEELETMDAPDVHLDQAAGIVTDMAVIREIEVAPTQSAQNKAEPGPADGLQ